MSARCWLAERAGDRAAARHAYLRAGNHFRTAGVMALSHPARGRARAADARQREQFSQAFELLDVPAQRLRVPFEGGTLPRLVLRRGRRRPAAGRR